ncbi:hypothetical protein ACFSKM_03615 [Ancylobacter dichloromethanicus]
MTNVLLSCAGRRVYLVDYFRAALAGSGRVIGTDMSLTAPAMAACDVARQVPACAAPDYLDRLKQAIRAEKGGPRLLAERSRTGTAGRPPRRHRGRDRRRALRALGGDRRHRRRQMAQLPVRA